MHAVILSSTTFSPTFDINSLKQVYFVSQMDNVHNLQRGGKLENRKRVSVSEFTDVELLTAMDLSDRVGDVAACSGYREWRPPNAKDHRLYFMIYRSRRLWKVWFSPSLRQVITRWSSGHVGNVWTSVWFLKPCYTRRTDGLSRRPNLTAHQVGSRATRADLSAVRSARQCYPSANCEDDGAISDGSRVPLAGDACRWWAELTAPELHARADLTALCCFRSASGEGRP